MIVRMEEFFRDVEVFAAGKKQERKLSIKSLVHPEEYLAISHRKKTAYSSFYEEMKNKIKSILNVAEKDFVRGGSKKAISEARKDGIAQAVLAMRNQLVKQAKHVELEKAYKSGYDVAQQVMNKEIGNNIRNNVRRIQQLRDEFDSDIERFVDDVGLRLDELIEEQESIIVSKEHAALWAALIAAIMNGLAGLEYRLRMIATEPYRRAYRLGAVDGLVKISEADEIEIKGWLWEATGEHPCNNCLALDGTVVPLQRAEQFLHPQCQCTLSLVVL